MQRADEWSHELHRALLAAPFILRSTRGQDGPAHQLLLKVLAHARSQTLAIVVIPLSSLAVLYEGLSFRTLQRRTKCSPPLSTAPSQSQTRPRGGTDSLTSHPFSLSSSSSISDTLFDHLSTWVRRAVTGEAGSEEAWLDCELGRSEATLECHFKAAALQQQTIDVSFDLSALDREEGPAFLRDHLLAPSISLAARGLASQRPAAEGAEQCSMGDVMSDLFHKTELNASFADYTRTLNGVSEEEAVRAGASSLPALTQDKPASPHHFSPDVMLSSLPVNEEQANTRVSSRSRSTTRSRTRSASPGSVAQSASVSASSLSPPASSSAEPARPPPAPISPPPRHQSSSPSMALSPPRAPPSQDRAAGTTAVQAKDDEDEDSEEEMLPSQRTSQQPRPSQSAAPPSSFSSTMSPPATPSKRRAGAPVAVSSTMHAPSTPSKDGSRENAVAGPSRGGRGASSYRRGLAKRQRI